MKCKSGKEVLSEIKRIMDVEDIPMKELASRLNKSQQALSRIFTAANPQFSTIVDICNALNLDIDVYFTHSNKSDAD